MKPQVLFIVTGDPRSSPRPAEAIRIAAGVSVWERVEIGLYLRGPAVLCLGESADGFVDEENFRRYLPILAKSTEQFYVEKEAPGLLGLESGDLRLLEVSDGELAELAVRHTYVLRF